jgi:hypothetical protein
MRDQRETGRGPSASRGPSTLAVDKSSLGMARDGDEIRDAYLHETADDKLLDLLRARER